MNSARTTRRNTLTNRQLSPRLSQLLYYLAVSDLKKERATRQTLAAKMAVSVSNIGYLINRLKAQSDDYLKSRPDEGSITDLASTERRPGRLPETYYLDVDKVVSLPETA